MKLMIVGPHSFVENGPDRWILRGDSQLGAPALEPRVYAPTEERIQSKPAA